MKFTNTQHFSGITVAEYRQIMKGDITVQFACTQCKEDQPEVGGRVSAFFIYTLQ